MVVFLLTVLKGTIVGFSGRTWGNGQELEIAKVPTEVASGNHNNGIPAPHATRTHGLPRIAELDGVLLVIPVEAPATVLLVPEVAADDIAQDVAGNGGTALVSRGLGIEVVLTVFCAYMYIRTCT